MRKLPVALLLSLMPALASFAEEASSGGESGAEGWMAPIWGVPMIVWQIANIILVVVLFVYLLRKPAPKYFKGRADEIQGLLEKAVKEKEDALARLKDVQDKMANLEAEVAGIEEAAKKAAEADKQRVQAEAEASRDRMRKEAAADMDRRMNEARRDLRAYAADLAVGVARDLIVSKITDEDERQLQAKFLSQVEEESHEQRG